jgi:hypothetical protein
MANWAAESSPLLFTRLVTVFTFDHVPGTPETHDSRKTWQEEALRAPVFTFDVRVILVISNLTVFERMKIPIQKYFLNNQANI